MKITDLFEVKAYHGSSVTDPVFTMGHTGTNSHTFGSYKSTRWGAFFSDNPKFSAMYGNVSEYDLYIHNTLVCSDNNVIWNFVQSLDAFNPDERGIWQDAKAIMLADHYWQLFEDEVGERFVSYIRDLGYDSATFVEYNEDDHGVEQKSNTIVVIEPRLIKRIR